METPGAGSSKQSENAAEHPLPSNGFYSIEYPGFVKPTSVPIAVNNLGGQGALERAFKRNASKDQTVLELRLRPDNPFAHPLSGEVVGTNNLLLKIRKRKWKVQPGNATADSSHVGDFTAEVVGVIHKTGRFRSMADFQYMPDMTDPVAQLRLAMDRLDAQAIKDFRISPEKEDYIILEPPGPNDPNVVPVERSNLRLFPPPVFSRQGIPQFYNYKANNMSVVTTVVDPETGEEKKRMINKARWKGYGPASISYSDKKVPTEPPPNVKSVKHQADQRILALLIKMFEERPIWTRLALSNLMTAADYREIQNSKILLPLVCYVFQDGPWRDTLVKMGYDPREVVEARLYQRLYFRNLNHPIVRPSVTSRRQEARVFASTSSRLQEGGSEQEPDRIHSHIFDGQTLTKETAAFQLCDITDSMLKGMIEDEDAVRDVCNERDGWYTAHAFERIKRVLRHKFFALLSGYVATEEECLALLEEKPDSTQPKEFTKRRPGKHNMAKGAIPPEDAAAIRLRATLDNAARSTTSKLARQQ